MRYYVNEDKPTNRATVHESTCGFCTPGYKDPKNGGWWGPYATSAEAFARARETGRANVAGCGSCNP